MASSSKCSSLHFGVLPQFGLRLSWYRRELQRVLPAPANSRMRASPRADERGVGLGRLPCVRDLANLLAFEQRLNSLNVAFLCQPTR